MEKKKITKTIFHKIDYNKPIPFGAINVELESDDVIFANFEEAEYRSDGGMDAHYYLTVTRDILETDEEYKKRVKRETKDKQRFKNNRLESYLKLKKEFEDANIGSRLVSVCDQGHYGSTTCSHCGTDVEDHFYECPKCGCLFEKTEKI